MKSVSAFAGIVSLFWFGCGGAQPEAAAPESSAPSEKGDAPGSSETSGESAYGAKSDEPASSSSGFPTSCAMKGGGRCLPS